MGSAPAPRPGAAHMPPLIRELTLFPCCARGRGLQKEPPRSCAATSGGARRPASPWRCGVGSRARAAASPRTGAPTATARRGRACRPPAEGPTCCVLWSRSRGWGVGGRKISSWGCGPGAWAPLFLPPAPQHLHTAAPEETGGRMWF